MEIVFENHKGNKYQAVTEVLNDLPEWFGLPESTKEYIERCQEYPMWIAKRNEDLVGFISLKETSMYTAEIYCMGVKKAYHNQGIGNKLINAFEDFCLNKFHFIQVKTVEEGHYASYDKTVAFYEKSGFKKLETFPKLWDEWNPCLLMVKAI